jgi:hypothetical protein
MGLIQDQQVKAARVDRFPMSWQCFGEETHWSIALEKIDRGDQARKVRPGIDMQTAFATQRLEQFAINDAEFQTKLIAHLVAPLHL